MRASELTRWILIGLVAILLVLGITAFFLPYLLKRHIERHSVEWIGRQVTIDRLVLDPFTFTYAVNGVECLEPGGGEVFVSWKSISVKSDLWAGFRDRRWRFREVRIEDPYFHIVQHGERFNFSDLLELGDDGAADTTAAEPLFFSMEDIRLTGGRILYDSDLLKEPIGISGLRAECTQITSESARMDFAVALTLDQGGELDGGFSIDTEKSRYAIRADLKSFQLPQLLPYLQDFMHSTDMRGGLDLRLDLEDSWADTAALAVSGDMRLQGFDVTDGGGGPLLAIGEGRIVLDTLNARDGSFKASRLSVHGLSTHHQQWADGSNTWTKVLKLNGTGTGDGAETTLAADPGNVFVLLAGYIRMLGREFVANEYTADSLLLVDGSVEFTDFTPEKPFRYTLDQLDVRSSRITSDAGTADFTASAQLNKRGRLNSTFRFDPKDFHNVVVDLRVEDMQLTDLDPYSRWYAAHPIKSGKLDYSTSTSIQGGRLDSRNHLVADNLRFDKKTTVHDTGIYVLPLRLGASLLRDVHGKIDLDIPVTGDLNDPEFHPWPIVWHVVKNLVTKAVAAPVRLVGGLFSGKEDEEVEEVRFPMLAGTIGKEQRKPLDALAVLLKEKPELEVALVSVTDEKEEAEEWAAQRMKMRFLGLEVPLSKDDSMHVARTSLRDSAFVAFLDGVAPGTAGLHERERCLKAAGYDEALAAVRAVEEQRRAAVEAYLETLGIPRERAVFREGTAEELTGHAGLPGFRFIVDVRDGNGLQAGE